VLQRFSCDIAILQESKMEDVSHPTAISLQGCRPVKWLCLSSMGRPGGIITIWDPQTLELMYKRIGSFSVCCKFKSLQDNFV